MDEFEEKLNAILNSPETMGQIMALANSLSGQAEGGAGMSATEGTTAAQPSVPTAPTALSPSNPLAILQKLDPAVLGAIGTLFQEYNRKDDEKAALLLALRPFLREERRARIEHAVQLTRVSRVIRAALRLFREAGHV